MTLKGKMMKRNLLLIPLITALASCGGSSSDSSEPVSPEPTLPVNTAPTLTGELALQTQAGVSSAFVYDLADKESDTISVEIDNLPEWATFSVTNNQLELSVEASLFDVASHTFNVNLSDGSDSNYYEVAIDVAENRELWQDLQLTKEELWGHWHSADLNTEFHFFKDEKGPNREGRGIIKNLGATNNFIWAYDSNQNLAYSICTNSCQDRQELDITIIARQNGAMKLLFTNDESEQIVVLYQNTVSEIPKGYYFALDSSLSLKNVSHFDDSTKQFEIAFLNKIETLVYDSTQYVNWLQGAMPESGNIVTNFSDPLITSFVTGFPWYSQDDPRNKLLLDVIADQVTFLPSINGGVAVEVKYHLELNELEDRYFKPIGQYQIEDFAYLSESLELVQYSTEILYPVEQITAPTMTAGNRYQLTKLSDLLPTREDALDILGKDSGGYNYVFESENSGYVELIDPFADEILNIPFTASYDNDELVLNVLDKTINIPFIKDVNDNIYALLKNRDNGLGNINDERTGGKSYLFKQLDSFRGKPFTLADYQKVFNDITYQSLRVDANTVTIDENILEVSVAESNRTYPYPYKFEENGSLSYVTYCGESNDFEQCSSYKYPVFRNLNIEKIEGDKVYLTYTYKNFTIPSFPTFTQDKRIYQIKE